MKMTAARTSTTAPSDAIMEAAALTDPGLADPSRRSTGGE
jgi:hypothetical protein